MALLCWLSVAACAKVSGTASPGSSSAAPMGEGAGIGIGVGMGVDAGLLHDGGLAVDAAVIVSRGTGTDAVVSDEPVACATSSSTAEKLPLDLYVMMDSSSSMSDATAAGPTKWQAVQTAMTSFFDDPASAGIGVELQYFPQVEPKAADTCLKNADCGNFGPCDTLSVCAGPKASSGTVCKATSDCPAGQSCVLFGYCALLQNACVPAGGVCPLGDPCEPFPGNCRARDKCDVPTYATAAVPIATLPGAAPALAASLNAHKPDGLTPTGPALSGAIQAAQARTRANPGHKVAILLVTDGLPTECTPLDVPGIAALARTAATGTPAIPTFVIGVFGPDDAAMATTNLNLLAQGGGTGSAVVINTNQDVTQALQTALNQIRTMAVACEYKIPAATGTGIDFGKVNVQSTGANGAPTTIGKVANQAACDPTRGGWYYDIDPSTGGTPTSIIACDSTCQKLQGTITVRVDIVLGCQTITII